MAKQKLPTVEELSEGTQELLDILNHEGALAVVVITASYLDDCLGAMLERHLRKGKTSEGLLDSRRGALGSFAVRADLCYSLHLIEKPMYQDLIQIAEIRNALAHNRLALSFESADIAARVGNLRYAEKVFEIPPVDPLDLGKDQLVRNRFVLTAVLISHHLLLAGLGIKPSGGPVASTTARSD